VYLSYTSYAESYQRGVASPGLKNILDILLAIVAERQCVHTHDLVREGGHAAPHIQTQEFVLVKHGAYVFPASLRDC
jgi:hypothetical protein